MEEKKTFKSGNAIITNSTFGHKVENVQAGWVKESAITKFMMKVRINKHPQHYYMFCYCSIFKPLDELGLRDGDSIIVRGIHSISFQSSANGNIYCYVTFTDIQIIKEDPEANHTNMPIEETIPDLPSDEDSPFDI